MCLEHVCECPQRPSVGIRFSEAGATGVFLIWILGNEPRSSGKAVRALTRLSLVSNLHPDSLLFLPFTPYISFLVFPHRIMRSKTARVCLVHRHIPVLEQLLWMLINKCINTGHIVRPIMYTVTLCMSFATTSFNWNGSYYYPHFADK